MRYKFSEAIKDARKKKGLTQETLAAASGSARITIARLEAGSAQDFRLGTLQRLCEALDLELRVAPKAEESATTLAACARERERTAAMDTRRRHAALAAALLALPAAEAAALVDTARATVAKWENEQLCGAEHCARWRSRLEGPVRTVALRLLEHVEGTEALLQNSPWSFALEPPAANPG